ncbi:MAG: winged helix-turn-helix transcriptional regulator [Candidatus Marinimicrobia bacterium]|nr:winged helix-turn-helix transcriptional regulator [Candidatus Neomarinimicrobiota bacterium]
MFVPIHVGSVLKSLGHPDRLRIIQYLSQGEQCVADIQHQVGLSQPITSQQLRIMADKHIVARRREGNMVYYRVANDFIWKILDCMHTLSAKIGSGEWSLERVGALDEGNNDD